MAIAQDRSLPVIVIGAGPGGLAFAQILKSLGIPFQIFERDTAPATRSQGYAVALNHCLPRLLNLLPSNIGDIHSTSVNAPVAVQDSGVVLHPITGDVMVKLGGEPVGQPGHLLRAKRQDLRIFLWKDLDVQCGKRFSYYTEDEHSVTAYFTDGTSVRGALLVGVDGAYSLVRSQLLSQTARAAPYVPIMGTVTLARSQFEPIHQKGTAAVIAGADDLRWVLSLIDIKPDWSSAIYMYSICYRSDSPKAEADWARNATKTELFNKGISLTKSTPQYFQDILHQGGPESINKPSLRFVEFEPPSSLPVGRVTLAGDAAHTMMPFKGAGANTAFLDICDLVELMIEMRLDGRTLADRDTVVGLLKKYESVMLPRGREMVASSGATGKGMSEILGSDKVMAPSKGTENGKGLKM